MTHHPARTRRLALGATAAVALVTGCSGGGDPAPTPTLDLTDSALVAGAYANPLDPVMFPDPTELATLTSAAEALITTCMAEHGFTYVPGDAFPRRRTAADAQYTYSVTDPAVAAEFGFHPASWVEEVRSASGSRPSPVPGYDEALFGQKDKTEVTDDQGTVIATYDPDSCVGRAKDSVTPDWAAQERTFTIAADILLDVADRVQQDDEVTAAMKDWSTCMRDRGFTYSSPMEANGDERFGTDLPTAEEIPVAVASAQCQHDSGLLRTWSRVRATLTQAALDAHPGIVSEWLSMQRSAVDRAGER